MASRVVSVYLEVGSTRTFAGALDWPGWCRSGKGQGPALAALFDCGPRYARALKGTKLGFKAPGDGSAFSVKERLKGNATTDFGAPDRSPSLDEKPLGPAELVRYQAILKACWRAFDAAVKAAKGKALRLGPRGGGRDLARMVDHVVESEKGYLRVLGVTFKEGDVGALRKTILEGVAASARGEIPSRGPRGGMRWTARYFVRRTAWHALDHAWEIEDRAKG